MRKLLIICDRCGAELPEDTEQLAIEDAIFDLCDTCKESYRGLEIARRTRREQSELALKSDWDTEIQRWWKEK